MLSSYERATKILSNCILLDQECHTDPAIDPPEKDFMVTSLDLIDGLVQGFEYHSVDLINQNHKSNLIELMLICFEDYNGDVRQSAYALLGDLAIFTIELLKPYLRQISYQLVMKSIIVLTKLILFIIMLYGH